MRLIKDSEHARIEKGVLGDKPYFKTTDNKLVNEKLEDIDIGLIKNFHLYAWKGDAFIVDHLSRQFFRIRSNNIEKLGYQGDYIYPLAEGKDLVFASGSTGKKISCYDSQNLLWSKSIAGFVAAFDSNFVVYIPRYRSKYLEVNSISDFSILCTYALGEEFVVSRTLHIYEQILVIPFVKRSSTREVTLIGLDVRKGKEVWKKTTGIHEYLLDRTSGFIYALFSSVPEKKICLQSIDVNSGFVSTTNLKEGTVCDIMPWNAKIRKKFLFYSDNSEQGKIGSVDLGRKLIVAEVLLNLKKGAKIGIPLVTANKVYVVDTLKNLHVVSIEK